MPSPKHPSSLFFRQLHTPIDAKGDALANQIAALNRGKQPSDTFTTTDPPDFALISGSNFAYWVSDVVRQLFVKSPSIQKSLHFTFYASSG